MMNLGRAGCFLPSPGGGGSASIARCSTGWGDSLAPDTARKERLSPHPAARCTRVDPPPPGEGDLSVGTILARDLRRDTSRYEGARWSDWDASPAYRSNSRSAPCRRYG